MRIPAFSVFVRNGCVLDAGATLKKECSLQFHKYFVSEGWKLNDTLSFLYGSLLVVWSNCLLVPQQVRGDFVDKQVLQEPKVAEVEKEQNDSLQPAEYLRSAGTAMEDSEVEGKNTGMNGWEIGSKSDIIPEK